MTITTKQVKALREKTGVSIMQCKKALEEAGGDTKKAMVILRKQAGATALGKGNRDLKAGVVEAYIHNTKGVGAMVMLSCETDFVAKNEAFIHLAREIAMQVVATAPKYARRENIDKEEQSTLQEVFEREAADKPASVKEKIVEGKFDAYFKEAALLEQPYIKDSDRMVRDLIEEAIQKFGERIELIQFTRYALH